jgi:hypothetical protein
MATAVVRQSRLKESARSGFYGSHRYVYCEPAILDPCSHADFWANLGVVRLNNRFLRRSENRVGFKNTRLDSPLGKSQPADLSKGEAKQ